MSRESREKRRREKKRKTIGLLLIIAALIAVILLVSVIKKRQKILTLSEWTQTESTSFYLFKGINTATINHFTESDLSVETGTKVNGYMVLTAENKVVSPEWAKKQLSIVKSLIASGAPDDWKGTLVNSLQAQKSAAPVQTADSVVDIAPYVGTDAETLNAKKALYEQLADGAERSITLQNLGMITSGNIFSTYTNRKKGLNETLLPYLDMSLLKKISGTENRTHTGLTVISNDHVFAVAVLPEDTSVKGEEKMLSLKQSYLESNGVTDEGYIKMLIDRHDLVLDYPKLTVSIDGISNDAYFVECRTDDGKKLVYLMFEDYAADYLDMDVARGDLTTQKVYGYVIPKSAIKKKDDKNILTLMERTYFPEEIEVNIAGEDRNHYVLSASDNPDLREGASYKVHP